MSYEFLNSEQRNMICNKKMFDIMDVISCDDKIRLRIYLGTRFHNFSLYCVYLLHESYTEFYELRP